ncbi:MAG: helicase-associated domain-containing protein [Methanosarcinales archaeon]|nr:helicase-associated domain-containing protein [Methanosarcinales archaeon]MCD4765501.1 helicase-associated domain-containing protein [Methanosarcinales archaeon]
MSSEKPLIIQSDRTLMLEVGHPGYVECRDFLALFAELVKSPEFIHTYRVTPLSLWNAAALGVVFKEIACGLEDFSRYDIPSNVIVDMREWHETYGKLVLQKAAHDCLKLEVKDSRILERIRNIESLEHFWVDNESLPGLFIPQVRRGDLKHALIKAGYPVKDLCGYLDGERFDLTLRSIDLDGNSFQLHDYQKDAADLFYCAGQKTGGSGVIVLPCGSGKTIIGLGTMAQISSHTLIITTNNVSVRQWRDELLSKTYIEVSDIGEFTGRVKEIKPITITTYQMLTHRRTKDEPLHNLDIFTEHNWGLIIYDEVHMLPAPVFRATTAIQARRRLGLTATLVREDGKEDDVFALIGPKRYDVPWKTLESRGYIAKAICTEYRVPLSAEDELEYAHADKRAKFRIAAENQRKTELVCELLENHAGESILIIGQFILQLEKLARSLDLPIITGKTRHDERDKLYDDLRSGRINILVVSKVANFAVDLPDASVMIQVSGTFGSRQEEAQRLGRILRPKEQTSHFYTLVSKGTTEQTFGTNRQLFLVEQGYRYQIRYF